MRRQSALQNAGGLDQILEQCRGAGDTPVRCDSGVTLLPAAERNLHSPDLHLLGVRGGSLVARCSCWWRGNRSGLGVIGHYASADAQAGAALLAYACDVLAIAGCVNAVGPMDGNTWRGYRFVVERGTEPRFFLEPDNPDDWPRHWSRAGFSPCATYRSSVNDDLSIEDPRTSTSLARLTTAGVAIRSFDPERADAELRRIFALSSVAFSANPFYGPISEEEFLFQYRAVLPWVRPELILVAEHNDALVGFMFALPDVLRQQTVLNRVAPWPAEHWPDTVILKTLAVDPSLSRMGLGGVLMDLVQRAARQLRFRRAIHALMHDTNASRRISNRYARTIRRYALFSRPLQMP